MKREIMKAELECFARAYHYRTSLCRVFSDEAAGRLLGGRYEKLEKTVTEKLASETGFPCAKENILERGMRMLCPEILAAGAFCEDALANAARLGCRQYLNIGAGFDTYSCRCNIDGIRIIEADAPEVLEAKRNALAACGEDITRAGYFTITEDFGVSAKNISRCGLDRGERAFVSFVNVSGEMTRTELFLLLRSVSEIIPSGSSVVLKYHGAEKSSGQRARRFMPDYGEAERLLSECGLRIYELLTGREAEKRFFTAHNTLEPDNILLLPENVRFCLAVKK